MTRPEGAPRRPVSRVKKKTNMWQEHRRGGENRETEERTISSIKLSLLCGDGGMQERR